MKKNKGHKLGPVFIVMLILMLASCVQKGEKSADIDPNKTSDGVKDFVPQNPGIGINYTYQVILSGSNQDIIKTITSDGSSTVILNQGDYSIKPSLSPELSGVTIDVKILHGLNENTITLQNNQEGEITLNDYGSYLINFEFKRNGELIKTLSLSAGVRCAGADQGTDNFSLYLENIKFYPLYVKKENTVPYKIDDSQSSPPALWNFSDYKIDLSGILSANGTAPSDIGDYTVLIDYNGDERFDIMDLNQKLNTPLHITSNYVLEDRKFKVRVMNKCFIQREASIELKDIKQQNINQTPSEEGSLETNPSKLVEYQDNLIDEGKSDEFLNFSVQDQDQPQDLALNANIISFRKSAFDSSPRLIYENTFMNHSSSRTQNTPTYKLLKNIDAKENTTSIELDVKLGFNDPLPVGIVNPDDDNIYELDFDHDFMSYTTVPSFSTGEHNSNTWGGLSQINKISSEEDTSYAKVNIPIKKFKFGVLGEKDITEVKLLKCNDQSLNNENCEKSLAVNIKHKSTTTTTTYSSQCNCQDIENPNNENPSFTDVSCQFEKKDQVNKFWVHFVKDQGDLNLYPQSTDKVSVPKIEGFIEITDDEYNYSSNTHLISGSCDGENSNSCPQLNQSKNNCQVSQEPWENGYTCENFSGVNNCGGSCSRPGKNAASCQLPPGITKPTYTCEQDQTGYFYPGGDNTQNQVCSGKTCTFSGTTNATCSPPAGEAQSDYYSCQGKISFTGSWTHEGIPISACSESCSGSFTGNKSYQCIYELTDDEKDQLAGMLTCQSLTFQEGFYSEGELINNPPAGCSCPQKIEKGYLGYSCIDDPNFDKEGAIASTPSCQQVSIPRIIIDDNGDVYSNPPSGCAGVCGPRKVNGEGNPQCQKTNQKTCNGNKVTYQKRNVCGQSCGTETETVQCSRDVSTKRCQNGFIVYDLVNPECNSDCGTETTTETCGGAQ